MLTLQLLQRSKSKKCTACSPRYVCIITRIISYDPITITSPLTLYIPIFYINSRNSKIGPNPSASTKNAKIIDSTLRTFRQDYFYVNECEPKSIHSALL